MSVRMPEKLGKSPLVEVVFEIRFEPTIPAAGDILPGLLYSQMKDEFPEVKALPNASVPREFREKTPDLKYMASHRLIGESKSVRIGDRVVYLTSLQYPGWTRFLEMVESLLEAVKGTGLTKQIERFSFKYVNLIEPSGDAKQLPLLNLRVEVIGNVPTERGFHFRSEYDEGKHTTILTISPGATAKMAGGKTVSGMIIEVDTIRFEPGSGFLTDRVSLLEEAHSIAKRTFFSLLTKDALERMMPVY